jgi:ferredoxin
VAIAHKIRATYPDGKIFHHCFSCMSARLDLTRYKSLAGLLRNPWPQFLIRILALAGFLFTILAGLLGTPVGSHNFAIIFVWIAWWSALKLIFIPFGGRFWCSFCPIPMPGEWLQRGGLLVRGNRTVGLGLPWPRRLTGAWLQASGFLLVGLFAAVTLTTPRVTAWMLLGFLVLALTMDLIFAPRTFCRRLCPIGGFTGLYAQVSPLEVRVKDPQVCATHSPKTCFLACPWGLYPLTLKSNADCGLCLECLRACPSDNIAINLRQWGADLHPGGRRLLAEAFLGLIMLASALVDAAVFLGPWGWLKVAAYSVGSRSWWAFSGGFLLLALVILPAMFILAVWLSARLAHPQLDLRQTLAHRSQVLVPLGLMAWIAFTISFALTKAGTIPSVLSDPLGWGWNLFGMAGQAGTGQVTLLSLTVQAVVLAVGLAWSCRVARRISASLREALPLAVFAFFFNSTMLWLLAA